MTENNLPGERDCVYEFEVEVQHLNEKQSMKPSSYLTLFARLAEQHLSDFSFDYNQTMQYGYAWALISSSIEIVKPVDSCLRLYASTWHSARKGPYFRRELLFRDASGETVFHGSTHSILLDIESRTVYRKKELPFSLIAPVSEFCVTAGPHFREDILFQDVEHRKVRGSYLDGLGHVNNCRYGDFAYDALTDMERARIGELKRMDMYFLSELRDKDEFTVQKSGREDAMTASGRRICIQGRNDTKEDISFTSVFGF